MTIILEPVAGGKLHLMPHWRGPSPKPGEEGVWRATCGSVMFAQARLSIDRDEEHRLCKRCVPT